MSVRELQIAADPHLRQVRKELRSYDHLNRSGRKPGQQNRETVMFREAMSNVYRDLQESEGGGNAHFLGWAKKHPTDFYRMCLKLVPLEIKAELKTGGVTEIMFRGFNDRPE